jgi:hypothetical protein
MSTDGHEHPAHDPAADAGHNHGNSVAAWAAVSVITLGFLLGAAAFPLGSPVLFWVGVVVAVLGVGVGKVLSMMGFGVAGHPVESATVTDP